MRKSTKSTTAPLGDGSAFDQVAGTVYSRTFADELASAYLEYSYSVIYARALPDARDGLKPVHRRILWAMHQMGVRPDVKRVKSTRVIGDTMGMYHPHGDTAIYDAMVRLARDFALSFPLIDGQGAFGTNDDGAAAPRYTEARMSHAAMLMLADVDDDTVDMRPNYDQERMEPRVLPAAFPNALVNGGAGVAVGMASKMIPHNLAETVEAARHLLANPDATLDDLMKHVPGPDLPTGGLILGTDKIREAYETGRGVIKIRARTEIGPIEGSRGRQAIIATELPYGIGPEKVIEAIRAAVNSGKLAGIADAKDLTDMSTDGTRLVIECKVGVNPEAVLADLFRMTPMQISFGIINNVLYRGKPQELGLQALLRIFIDHRIEVVTRRSEYRRAKARTRQHLVEGLLVALDNVDKVVKIIRSSPSTSEARQRLLAELGGAKVKLGDAIEKRNLDDIQVDHILEMPLRRLVSLELDTLRDEWTQLRQTIATLTEILESDQVLRDVIDSELAEVTAKFGRPRRTTLVDGDLADTLEAEELTPLEIPDEPCTLVLSTTGVLGRFPDEWERRGRRGRDDLVALSLATTAQSAVAAITDTGRCLFLSASAVVAPPAGDEKFRGANVSEFFELEPDEQVIALVQAGDGAPMLALASEAGAVKRILPSEFAKKTGQPIIGLKDGDRLVAAVPLDKGREDDALLVFVTSDAQLLKTSASGVRPQGRTGGGVAGVKLSEGAKVIAFGAVDPDDAVVSVTVVTDGASAKATPVVDYPSKGRAGAGVRCTRLLKGETRLVTASVGYSGAVGVTTTGSTVDLPTASAKRDAAGTRISDQPVTFARLR